MAILIKRQRQHQTILALIASCGILMLCLGWLTPVNAYRLNSLYEDTATELQESESPSSASASASASTSLKSLQSKLDLILDTESHEKKLLESLLFESEQKESKQAQTALEPQPKSLESIVSKLLENSGRMESMIGMLSDFKTVLSQSISTEEKQLGYKTEVVQLREEVNYLREEIQKMKSQQAAAEARKAGLSSEYRNKIHNDEATINWLKDSVKELRHEIVEVSASLNVTGLLHLQQQLRLQEKSTSRDVLGLQRQIEGLQVNSDQVSEQLLEIQADVADVRTWQVKMGQKLVREQSLNSNSIETSQGKSQTRGFRDQDRPDETLFDRRVKLLQESLEGYTEIHKKNNNKNARRHSSSSKKQLKLELHRVEKVLLEMVRDQDALAQKVKNLEMSGSTSTEHERAIWKKVVQVDDGRNDADTGDDGLVTITYSEVEDDNSINDGPDSRSQRGRRSTRRIRRGEVNYNGGLGPLTNLQSRVSALEKSLAEHANGLDLMDNKVAGLSELHTTTKTLFTSLETIESKYDLKIADLQSTTAKVEAGVSGLQVATDELKEQQNLQNQMQQSCKKETRALNQAAQTTQLRIAGLQNQILKWGLKLCEATNKDSIRSIESLKIASLAAH